MAIFGSLSGDLSLDSPALRGVIRRALGEPALQHIGEIYKFGFQINGYSDAPIKREVGASFNPRPARICDLVSKEVLKNSASAALLGASILICALEDTNSSTPFGVEEKTARNALLLLKGEKLTASREEIALASAFALDKLRHLHMSELSDEKKDVIRESAQRMITLIEEPSYLKGRLERAVSRIEAKL